MKMRHVKLTKQTQFIMDYYHFKSIGQMLRVGEIFLTELQELITEEVDKQLIELLRGK